ncbi:MAG: nucleoside-diphosphate kinase [Verrucomicrobiales bacterium]|jgi:nucleoside-diphosphate kinase|nr:nucleoside-diphosphate kinase [Verrucomicrobiales bacterium]MDB2347146.1 nucleoside-diphosphate kinase [Verrucomicrobiales bacterium]MDF1790056.1 nucleoside-diphosphate kinase [Verrucomicrobiales bacterium]
MPSTEISLILLKPDTVSKGRCGEILKRFEAQGFKVRGMKMMRLSSEILAEHYSHLADKPFFPTIVEFMQSAPVVAVALSGENAISRVRDLLGPTDSTKADKGTIRGDLGEDMMVNCAHASDSPESAAAELKRFFAEGEVLDH